MANDTNTLKLDQTIHGYKGGHELLASSVKLPRPASMTLLEMSDSPGPGFADDKNTCITGYPVEELGMYALAKTWPAPEMRRPGCVWTHTLLIKYSDLSRIKDLSSLNMLFKKPSIDSYNDFRDGIIFLEDEYKRTNKKTAEEEILHLIIKLYTTKENVVIPRQKISDEAIFNIWSQQWPKLRRSFKFRTWIAYSRPKNKQDFDLLLNTTEYNLSEDNFEPTSEWELKEAVEDAHLVFGGNLRKFFWKHGADSSQTREAYIPLLRAWKLSESTESNYDSLSSLLLEWPSRPPSITRSIANNISTAPPASISLNTANLLIAELPRIREADISKEVEVLIGRSIGANESIPPIKTILNEKTELYPGIAQGVIEEVSSNIAINLIEDEPDLLDLVMSHKPEILQEPEFWDHEDIASTAIGKAPTDLSKEIIRAIINSKKGYYSKKAIERFGASAVDCILDRSDTSSISKSWLIAASSKPKILLNSLNNHRDLPLDALEHISSYISPLVENPTDSTDAWISALANHSGTKIPKKLSLFLLIRGLADVGPEQKKLIQTSFDSIFESIEKYDINWGEWSQIDKHIEYQSSWFPLTKIEKYCSGLVNLILIRDYSIIDILELTTKKKAVKLIVRQILSKDYGGKFLTSSIEKNKNNIPKNKHSTLNYIKSEINKYKKTSIL